jgi:hypothetical protein
LSRCKGFDKWHSLVFASILRTTLIKPKHSMTFGYAYNWGHRLSLSVYLLIYLFVHIPVGLFYIVLLWKYFFVSLKCLFGFLVVCLSVCLSCLFVLVILSPPVRISQNSIFLFCIFHCLVSGDQPDKDRDFLRHSPF